MHANTKIKHRTSKAMVGALTINQYINNNRATALERTAALATGVLKYFFYWH